MMISIIDFKYERKISSFISNDIEILETEPHNQGNAKKDISYKLQRPPNFLIPRSRYTLQRHNKEKEKFIN